jgi:oleate hydratase
VGCLPVPIGALLKELLDSIPSVRVWGRSVLDEIQSAEVTRKSATKNGGTSFLVQKDHTFQNIPMRLLNLGIKHRLALVRLILKGERRLGRGQIKDFLPSSFFRARFGLSGLPSKLQRHVVFYNFMPTCLTEIL